MENRSPLLYNWPRDLSELTREQFDAGVKSLMKKSFARLRKEQDIIQIQIGWADRQRNEVAARTLNVLHDMRSAAVDRKCFPNEPPCNFYVSLVPTTERSASPSRSKRRESGDRRRAKRAG